MYIWDLACWHNDIHSMCVYNLFVCIVLFTYLQQNISKPPFAQNKFSCTLCTACHPSTQVWSFCQHGWGKGIWWWKPETPASHFRLFFQKMCEIRRTDYRWVFSWPKRGGETEILYIYIYVTVSLLYISWHVWPTYFLEVLCYKQQLSEIVVYHHWRDWWHLHTSRFHIISSLVAPSGSWNQSFAKALQ